MSAERSNQNNDEIPWEILQKQSAVKSKESKSAKEEYNKWKEKEAWNKMHPIKLQDPAELYNWDNRKFEIGLSGFTGVGWTSNASLVNLVQLNIKLLLSPPIYLSLHGSFNVTLFEFELWHGQTDHALPVLLNFGYGNYHRNLFWFIEGGGGTETQFLRPVINIAAGMEWLVFQNWSLGFKVISGIIYREIPSDYYSFVSFGILALTANLVF